MQGSLFTVFAPSGAGKTSLVKALVDTADQLCVSISHTTRNQRPGEEDGVNYHFIDEAEFLSMINKNAFLEHAKVFSNYYGTSEKWVKDTLATGMDVILEIDWQGAEQVKRLFPSAISVCIIPPSTEVLRSRLTQRGQDNEDVIQARMSEAQAEASHYVEADYLIVNDDFDEALSDFLSVVHAQRLTLNRQRVKQEHLIRNLLA